MTTATGARDQVARLLTLVPFLHSHSEVTLKEAADTIGTTPRQLVKDLRVLFFCGLPGGYPDDLIEVDLDLVMDPETEEVRPDGVIRIANADYLSKPMRLSTNEATAMIVALRHLRDSTGEDTRDVVDRTLAKLEAAATHGGARVEPGTETSADDQARRRSDLEEAARAQRQVRLSYYVPARDEVSERVVDPRGVVTDSGVAYLDAWCHSAEAPRLFRLDRIYEYDVLDDRIETAQQPPRALSEAFFTQSDETTLVTLRLAPAARWMVEYYPVETIEEFEDGSLGVELRVADQRWLQRLLMRLAPYATVISPAEAAQQFTVTAQQTLELYR